LLAWGCNSGEEKEAAATLPVQTPVKVKAVTRISEERVISVSGALEADKTAVLSFQVPGKIQRLGVDEGDFVARGTLLAELDPTDYRNGLNSADAALFRARDAFERYVPLLKEGAVAEQSFIEVKTSLAEAKAARDTARKALADTRLVAPFSGIVGTKGVEIGQTASPEVPAFTVVKTDLIYARVSVPEFEIGQVALGQNATIELPSLKGRVFHGKVSMVGVVADESTRTYPVKIELQNPDFFLRPGMIVEANILTETQIEALTVPGQAVVRDVDNLTYVFVTNDTGDMALRKRIELGSTYGDEIVVESGLAAEDVVVVAGQHKLADGAAIISSGMEQGRQ
jgi:RND family efflux transporter MFP subunit